MSTIIKSFEAKELKKRSWAIRMADRLATFFGSIQFLILTFVFFALWIVVNKGLIPGIAIFDPYPYVLLITTVSLEAIVLTVVVLMSQNRQNYVSTLREEIDFQVDLVTEKEISKALKLLVKIAQKQGITITDKEIGEMVDDVEVSYIERRLQAQMNPKTKSLAHKITKPFKNVTKKK
ncbi:DUF1003 domain-containing protein [Candidatus Microgenomates bacterium]|nr:DUF1003 domain-containing protein [Candidatus Microgenomates bacterium]